VSSNKQSVQVVFHDHAAHMDEEGRRWWRVSLFRDLDSIARVNVGVSIPAQLVSDENRRAEGETNGQTIDRLLAPLVRLIDLGVELTAHTFDGTGILHFRPLSPSEFVEER